MLQTLYSVQRLLLQPFGDSRSVQATQGHLPNQLSYTQAYKPPPSSSCNDEHEKLSRFSDKGTAKKEPIQASKDMQILIDRIADMLTPESMAHGDSFRPRESDIIITTIPKSGTTWVGYICHMLRSNCDIDSFSCVEELMPWIPAAFDYGIDLNKNCWNENSIYNINGRQRIYNNSLFNPRLFMSHTRYEYTNKGCKYILVLRDPCDVLSSWHKFFCTFHMHWCKIEEWAPIIFFNNEYPSGTWYTNILSWLDKFDNDNDGNVLVLFYEDLHEDRRACIEKIYDFMELDKIHNNDGNMNGINESNYNYNPNYKKLLIDKVNEMSSYQYMSQKGINDKFRFRDTFHLWLKNHPQIKQEFLDENGFQTDRDEDGKLIRFPGYSNVDKGKIGASNNSLSKELIEQCDQEWIDKMKDKTGTSSYQEFRKKHSFLYAKHK